MPIFSRSDFEWCDKGRLVCVCMLPRSSGASNLHTLTHTRTIQELEPAPYGERIVVGSVA